MGRLQAVVVCSRYGGAWVLTPPISDGSLVGAASAGKGRTTACSVERRCPTPRPQSTPWRVDAGVDVQYCTSSSSSSWSWAFTTTMFSKRTVIERVSSPTFELERFHSEQLLADALRPNVSIGMRDQSRSRSRSHWTGVFGYADGIEQSSKAVKPSVDFKGGNGRENVRPGFNRLS